MTQSDWQVNYWLTRCFISILFIFTIPQVTGLWPWSIWVNKPYKSTNNYNQSKHARRTCVHIRIQCTYFYWNSIYCLKRGSLVNKTCECLHLSMNFLIKQVCAKSGSDHNINTFSTIGEDNTLQHVVTSGVVKATYLVLLWDSYLFLILLLSTRTFPNHWQEFILCVLCYFIYCDNLQQPTITLDVL